MSREKSLAGGCSLILGGARGQSHHVTLFLEFKSQTLFPFRKSLYTSYMHIKITCMCDNCQFDGGLITWKYLNCRVNLA